MIPLKIMHPGTDAAAAAFALPLAVAIPLAVAVAVTVTVTVAPGDMMDVPFTLSSVTLVVSKYDLVPGEVMTATTPFPILDWGMGFL